MHEPPTAVLESVKKAAAVPVVPSEEVKYQM